MEAQMRMERWRENLGKLLLNISAMVTRKQLEGGRSWRREGADSMAG